MHPKDEAEPMSVAEMGGASLQVTISGGRLPDRSACEDFFAPIALPHTPLDGCRLLTHSFMGFGREEAFKRVSAAGPAAAAHCSHLGYEFAPGTSTPAPRLSHSAPMGPVLPRVPQGGAVGRVLLYGGMHYAPGAPLRPPDLCTL